MLPFLSCIILKINSMLIWLNIWHSRSRIRLSTGKLSNRKVTIGSFAMTILMSGIESFQQSGIMIHSIFWNRKELRQRWRSRWKYWMWWLGGSGWNWGGNIDGGGGDGKYRWCILWKSYCAIWWHGTVCLDIGQQAQKDDTRSFDQYHIYYEHVRILTQH